MSDPSPIDSEELEKCELAETDGSLMVAVVKLPNGTQVGGLFLGRGERPPLVVLMPDIDAIDGVADDLHDVAARLRKAGN